MSEPATDREAPPPPSGSRAWSRSPETRAEAGRERRRGWQRLERLIAQSEARKTLGGAEITELCRLHRAACRDLSHAIANREPGEVVEYLHGLVGRGHAVLYRFERLRLHSWRDLLFSAVPARLYRDPYLWVSAAVFFGLGLISASLAFYVDGNEWERLVLGEEFMEQLNTMYASFGDDRDLSESAFMTSFYIRHNISIALKCFAYGIFFGLGSLVMLISNALALGAAFGFMLEGPYGDNFLNFVTAHAPFELTAITLAGAAGLRIGLSVVKTDGLTRTASLRKAARESVPIVTATCLLLLGAAIIEGFFSPLPIHYGFKLPVFMLSVAVLVLYFVVLGRMGHEAELAADRNRP